MSTLPGPVWRRIGYPGLVSGLALALPRWRGRSIVETSIVDVSGWTK